jgi:hypothetical protein
MTATIRPAPPAPTMPRGRRRTAAAAPGAADSPDAPYLRRWLGHQAARHRDLLLNIAAASRLSIVSAGSTR